MKRLSMAVLALMSLAVPFAAVADDDDRDYRRRGGIWRDDRYGRNDRYGYGRQDASVVRRAIQDLRQISRRARVDGHERDHIHDGINRLQRFQSSLRSGRWDGDALDKAIEDVRDLAQADQLHPRDRRVLADDLAALRHFRSTRGDYRSGSYDPYRNRDWRW